MTRAISTKPAVPCPLRDEVLIEPSVCPSCIFYEDYTEYYAPREGGVLYCRFTFSIPDHAKAYYDFRKGTQDEAMRQLHRDEAKRVKGAVN